MNRSRNMLAAWIRYVPFGAATVSSPNSDSSYHAPAVNAPPPRPLTMLSPLSPLQEEGFPPKYQDSWFPTSCHRARVERLHLIMIGRYTSPDHTINEGGGHLGLLDNPSQFSLYGIRFEE